jgi:hypothetical protein
VRTDMIDTGNLGGSGLSKIDCGCTLVVDGP